MRKITLKELTGKEVIKIEKRHFNMISTRNIGVLELAKEKVNFREFGNNEINKINSNIDSLKENLENFVNYSYKSSIKNEKDFLLFYKIVKLIDNKFGIVFGFVERNEKEGIYHLWSINDKSSELQFPQSFYHSGKGFSGFKMETNSILNIKEYIKSNNFKRFNAEKVAKEVFESFGIEKENQFQVVENIMPTLDSLEI